MKTKETGPLEKSAGNAADNDAGHPVHAGTIAGDILCAKPLKW
ncbi:MULTISPECIES: hypothetical protein [unclassified Ruegeria]|nr:MULTISPECIES: hypothetical protein [unclassified Ruegeria]